MCIILLRLQGHTWLNRTSLGSEFPFIPDDPTEQLRRVPNRRRKLVSMSYLHCANFNPVARRCRGALVKINDSCRFVASYVPPCKYLISRGVSKFPAQPQKFFQSTFPSHHNSRRERLSWGNQLVAGLTAKRFVPPVVPTWGGPLPEMPNSARSQLSTPVREAHTFLPILVHSQPRFRQTHSVYKKTH